MGARWTGGNSKPGFKPNLPNLPNPPNRSNAFRVATENVLAPWKEHAPTMDEPYLYIFYKPAVLNAKIFYAEERPSRFMGGDGYYWYEEKQHGDTFNYRRSWVTVDDNGFEEEEQEEFFWPTFAEFRDATVPIARQCGPRILKCLGPIAKNDPAIKNAASRWRIVREHVVKRRIGFYWHDLTQHLMQDGGVAQERDRLAFEADKDDELKRAPH